MQKILFFVSILKATEEKSGILICYPVVQVVDPKPY